MTFPWKKVKSSGLFSRLVADLHQPPRRGGTLVVETGFPTSLIDIIVKNRDRLRKSPKSKSTPQTQIQITTPTTTITTQLPCDNENNQSPRVDVAKLVLVESELWRGMFPFRAAFKVVVVVALAVSTRKLALWIMIAAFFLLVIEFIIGSSVFGFLRSKSHAIFPDSLTGKGSSEQATVPPDISNTEDNCIVEEIQIAESEVEEEEMETRIRRKDEQQQQQHGESESESGRIRRRHLIKKLVPKKLLRHGRRRRKKKKGEEKSENDYDRCAWEAGEIHKKEEEEIEEEEEDESQEGCEQVSWSGGGLMGVIVIVIVVAGVVVGGRGIGLLVTLVWLLMVTYVKERFQMLKI